MAFLAGVGGGAFFPMFAALVPDYFGENYSASNYGAVYSAKLASSLVGIGLGSAVIHSMGYTGAYLIGAGVAVLSAGIALMLRQPKRLPDPAGKVFGVRTPARQPESDAGGFADEAAALK
jgi:MFS family permease